MSNVIYPFVVVADIGSDRHFGKSWLEELAGIPIPIQITMRLAGMDIVYFKDFVGKSPRHILGPYLAKYGADFFDYLETFGLELKPVFKSSPTSAASPPFSYLQIKALIHHIRDLDQLGAPEGVWDSRAMANWSRHFGGLGM